MLQSYMEKLIVEEQVEQPSTAKLAVQIMIFDTGSYSARFSVHSQVLRCCMHPKGPLRPSDQPGCYYRRCSGRCDHFSDGYNSSTTKGSTFLRVDILVMLDEWIRY